MLDSLHADNLASVVDYKVVLLDILDSGQAESARTSLKYISYKFLLEVIPLTKATLTFAPLRLAKDLLVHLSPHGQVFPQRYLMILLMQLSPQSDSGSHRQMA